MENKTRYVEVTVVENGYIIVQKYPETRSHVAKSLYDLRDVLENLLIEIK